MSAQTNHVLFYDVKPAAFIKNLKLKETPAKTIMLNPQMMNSQQYW